MAWNCCGDWPAAKNRASSVAQPFHRNVQQIRPAAGADIWAGELAEPAKLMCFWNCTWPLVVEGGFDCGHAFKNSRRQLTVDKKRDKPPDTLRGRHLSGLKLKEMWNLFVNTFFFNFSRKPLLRTY